MARRIIASAEVEVRATVDGVERAIGSVKSQFNSLATNINSSASRWGVDKALSKLGDAAKSVGRTVDAGINAALLTTAGILTTSLAAGFGRFTTIEDSTARLTTLLGDAGKAGDLLAQTLNVVKGTPFNLDQFAGGAATLVGFGVEAEKVPGYLTAIGEAAAGGGARANEWAGRLMETWGKMSTSGRIYMDDVNSLALTGVDALKILANNYGVTTDEMRKMISGGMVPASEAMDILADGIINGSEGAAGATVALGGSMEALGLTMSGVLGNLRASMARFGATMWTEAAPGVKRLATAMTGIFDELGEAIGPIIGRIVNSPGFERFLTWFEGLPDKIGPAIDKITEFGSAIGPLLGVALAKTTGSLSGMLGPLGSLLPAINPVVGAFAGLILQDPELRAMLGELVTNLGSALAPLLPKIGDLLNAVADAFAALVPGIIALVDMLLPPLIGLLDAIIPVLTQVIQWVTAFLDAMPPPVLMAIAAAFALLWLGITGPAALVIAAIVGIVAVIVSFKDQILAVIGAVIDWVADNWPLLIAIITGPIGIIVAVVIENWETIRNFIMGVVNAIGDFLTAAWNAISSVATTVWNAIRSTITSAINTVRSTVTSVVETVRNTVTNVWQALKNTVTTIWNGIKTAVMTPINAVRDTISGVVNTIKGYITGPFDTIAGIVGGAMDAVKSAILGPLEAAADAVGGIVDRITGPIRSIGGGIGGVVGKVGGLLGFSHGGYGDFGAGTLAVLHGREAVVPLENPRAAARVIDQTGLDGLFGGGLGGGPLINIESASFADGTDVDLVGQRLNVAVSTMLAAS